LIVHRSGFSQGAAATAITLAHLQELKAKTGGDDDTIGNSLKFAILAGAFLPRDAEVALQIARARPTLTTMFISGENDKHVPPPR